MKKKMADNRGNVVLFLVSGIAMAAAIGISMFYMRSTQELGQAFGSETNRAYYLALAGQDYAIANWNNTTQFTHDGTVYEFVVSKNVSNNIESFSFSFPSTPILIISTGIINEGTPFEARRTIIASQPSIHCHANLTTCCQQTDTNCGP
jgi:hypothetical protein